MPRTCLSQDVQFLSRFETLRWSRHSSYISNSRQNSQNFRNRKSISGSISERLTLNPIHEDIVVLFKWGDFHLIRWIRRIGQNHPYMNQDRFAASDKHKKHSSVNSLERLDSYAKRSGFNTRSGLSNFLQIFFVEFIYFDENYDKNSSMKSCGHNSIISRSLNVFRKPCNDNCPIVDLGAGQ